MNVLVGCEESQAVTIELRKLGHEAYSCDTEECSGGHSEWHIKGDVLKSIEGGKIKLQNGEFINIVKWDMGIFFPPCTFLSNVANRWYKEEYNLQYNLFKGLITRQQKRIEAYEFFMKLVNSPIDKIAMENPVGIIQKWYRKYDQIIHPYYFGDPFKKRTCLWLKNLPLLKPTNMLKEPEPYYRLSTNGKPIQWCESLGRSPDRAKIRSKTFPSIAKAMAEQWTN